jgi:pumilio family protein 6
VEEIYFQYASGTNKAAFVEELYGKEFALFKTETPRKLNDVITKDPSKKKEILDTLYKNISHFLNKGIITPTIVHRAMYEFVCNAEDAQIQVCFSSVHCHSGL